MSVTESAGSAVKPLDSEYLSVLLDHIDTFQDHLDGNDGTPLLLSFLPPNAVWTAREKDTFFHALSVYSRLRPDLISHEIKTKSVQDVCNYLSILHAASSRQESAVSYPQRRQNLPIAMEVSSEWVTIEEEKAADLIAREQDWRLELTTEQRHAEIKLLKKTFRNSLHDMGPSKRKAVLKQQIADVDLRTRRKDFCRSLGFPELTAIDTILREATDFSSLSQIEQPSTLHAPTLQHSAGHVAGPEATRTLPFSATNGAHETFGVDITVRMTPGISTSFSTVAGEQAPLNKNINGGPSPLDGPGQTPASSPEQDSAALLEGLSPASRRRYQKRLYMRRKRASMSGVAVIDGSLERLKPGRKKVKRPSPPKGESQCDPECVEDEGGTVVDGPRATQKRYPRVKQMALDELWDLGLAANDLGRLGVDVLNLVGVAKMLNLWDKLSGDTAGHGSRISIETIQLLNLHVVWFIKNLVYRAITLREQEQIFKSETKVWKLSGKAVLTREHIERAVSMTNTGELSKARFFERIIAEMNSSTEAGKIGREFTGDSPEAAPSQPHRDICTPPVWMPELGDDSEMPDNTDEEELDSELSEEEELDKLDMDFEIDLESGLWDEEQRFQTSDPSIEMTITRAGQRTIYKSAEFIEDSD